MLQSLGVPGKAPENIYNYLAYTLWSYELGPSGVAAIWNDPVTYLGTESGLGNRKSQIITNMLRQFKSMGVKVLVSAFGAFEMPTTKGINPLACAKKLATFVINNELDGVDISYFDDFAMASGTA